MEPNTLYLFNFESDKDESEFFAKINCVDITWADTVQTDGLKIKSKYCFRLELPNKVHLFSHDLATVVNNWLRGVKTGKKCELEKMRAQREDIKKNVDHLIWYYRKKMTDEIMRYIQTEFQDSLKEDQINENSKVTPFLKTTLKCHDNMVDVGLLNDPDSRCPSGLQTVLHRFVSISA